MFIILGLFAERIMAQNFNKEITHACKYDKFSLMSRPDNFTTRIGAKVALTCNKMLDQVQSTLYERAVFSSQ